MASRTGVRLPSPPSSSSCSLLGTYASFARRRISRRMVVRENESISRLADYRSKNVPRMTQRLVDTSLGDFNGGDVAVARVQQNDPHNLLVEKLHIGAGSIG